MKDGKMCDFRNQKNFEKKKRNRKIGVRKGERAFNFTSNNIW